MNPIETSLVPCPYCGSVLELEIETTGGSYSTVEDCHICCRPIEISIDLRGDIPGIEVKTGDG